MHTHTRMCIISLERHFLCLFHSKTSVSASEKYSNENLVHHTGGNSFISVRFQLFYCSVNSVLMFLSEARKGLDYHVNTSSFTLPHPTSLWWKWENCISFHSFARILPKHQSTSCSWEEMNRWRCTGSLTFKIDCRFGAVVFLFHSMKKNLFRSLCSVVQVEGMAAFLPSAYLVPGFRRGTNSFLRVAYRLRNRMWRDSLKIGYFAHVVAVE